MIRYDLKCANDHGFESWFQSTGAFDRLRASGMVSCAECGSTDISKSLMTPSVRPAHKAGAGADTDTGARAPWREKNGKEAMLARLKAEIEANSEYVGMNFATEARAIHEGDAPERPIYGEARPQEARTLIEDGVPVAPLPFMPTRRTN